MPRKGETTVDKDILAVLEERKGYGLRFSYIFHALSEHNMFHYQQQISNNLKKLIEEGKVAKVKGKTRYFYGIPLQREDGTRYLTIRGAIKDEEIEVE